MKILILILLISTQAYASNTDMKADAKTEPMHCEANEAIAFNCAIGKKILSICASPKAPPYQSLEYRYGPKDKIEMRYTANHANKNRFYGFWPARNSKADIAGVGFSQGDTDYVITECSGLDCNVEAGLIVLKKGKRIFTKACGSNVYGSEKAPLYGHAVFSDELDPFIRQNPLVPALPTDLVIFDDNDMRYDIGVGEPGTLYPGDRLPKKK